MDGYEPSGECWEPNLSFLQDQQALLGTELSLSPVPQSSVLRPRCDYEASTAICDVRKSNAVDGIFSAVFALPCFLSRVSVSVC